MQSPVKSSKTCSPCGQRHFQTPMTQCALHPRIWKKLKMMTRYDPLCRHIFQRVLHDCWKIIIEDVADSQIEARQVHCHEGPRPTLLREWCMLQMCLAAYGCSSAGLQTCMDPRLVWPEALRFLCCWKVETTDSCIWWQVPIETGPADPDQKRPPVNKEQVCLNLLSFGDDDAVSSPFAGYA